VSKSNPVRVQLPMFDGIEIRLSNGLIAVIDPIDSDLAQHKWCSSGEYTYPQRRVGKGKVVFMHRIVLERMIGRALNSAVEHPDHIDGDPLNCRRNNLRLATKVTNAQNSKRRSDNQSGYKGVCTTNGKSFRPWRAYIRVEGHQISLGYFDTPEEAYAAYCEAARRYFGNFARLK
jgi:hypothetical protein